MKHLSLRLCLAALGALAMGACQDKGPTFTVQGTIEGAKDSVLYLYNRSLNGIVLMDSVKLGDNGQFELNGAAPTAPDFYLLQVNGQFVSFAVDSTETVTIRGKMPGLALNYTVEGSETNEKIRQITLKHNDLQNRVIALERNTSLMGQPMVDSLQRLLSNYKTDMTMNYIFAEPNKAYAYYALKQTLEHLYWAPHPIFDPDDTEDAKAYRAVATSWHTYYPESERGQQLVNQVEQDIQNQRIAAARQQQILENTQIVESGIIDLSLPDLSGHQRTLSELAGKVVLLDFHLFADNQSAARILTLRELYNKYHDQGLEIYQVSVDQDDHLWRQAVSQLPWVSVYDPSGSSLRQYNVQAIPDFFIISRQSQLQKRAEQMTDVEAEIKALL